MSRNVGYTTVFKEAFIADVRQRPALWNRNDSKYGDRLVCQQLWDEVALQRGMERDAAKKMWKSLVDQFRKIFLRLEKRGLDQSQLTEESDSQTGKWSLITKMFFISNNIARRHGNTSYLPTTDESFPDNESTETEEGFHTDCIQSESLINEQSMESELNSSEKALPENSRKRVLAASKCSANEKRIKASNGEASVLKHLSTLSKAIEEVSTNLSTVCSGSKSSAFTNLVLEQMESVPSHLRMRCMIGILQVIESFVTVPAPIEFKPNAEVNRTDR